IEGDSAPNLTIASMGTAHSFYVGASGDLTLRDVTISRGAGAALGDNDGGAIYNDGTVTLSGDTFTNNVAVGRGGAIFNNGVATLTNDTFTHNSGFFGGGGFY